jgi:hypothetical protein
LYSYLNRKVRYGGAGTALRPVARLNGSNISSTPTGVTVTFGAIVVDKPREKCIELFTPDEFERYGNDPKWAISSTLGFKPGLFDRLPDKRKAKVTGKYVFVRDAHDGPCGVITGNLFEIGEIEYF